MPVGSKTFNHIGSKESGTFWKLTPAMALGIAAMRIPLALFSSLANYNEQSNLK
jgi:hypothetical protein